jgi:hypothetical protein
MLSIAYKNIMWCLHNILSDAGLLLPVAPSFQFASKVNCNCHLTRSKTVTSASLINTYAKNDVIQNAGRTTRDSWLFVRSDSFKSSTHFLGQGCRTYGTQAKNSTRHSLLSHLVLFILPHHRLYTVHNMCTYTHIWLCTDCIWITVVTK